VGACYAIRMDHAGSCHCGAIGFTFSTEIPPAAWAPRACQCTFCRAHQALCVSDPRGAVAWTHRDPAAVVRYRFALGVTDFLLCARCGVYLAAVSTVDGRELAVINTRALAALALAPAQPMVYDGETVDARLARRAERWTPVRA
jgi:hypothetical protein